MKFANRYGTSLFMPAFVPGNNQALSLKVVSIFPDNSRRQLPIIHAAVIVLEAETGQILAQLEGSSLTAIRTGAASGTTTDLLARPNAKTATIYGAGVQGRTQLEAICSVRQIKSVVIVDPNVEKAKSFSKEIAGQGNIPNEIRVMTDPDDAARFADIISTATTSDEPIYLASAIRPGTHFNGVGSYKHNMVENPPDIYNRANAFVDFKEAALAEAGETAKAINKKILKKEDLVEIGKVCLGECLGRISDQQISFFKSVGIAVQDAVAAQLALKITVDKGLGQTIDF